jgi:anti-sigma regulatory factor (Ser/Thr protein kinase)
LKNKHIRIQLALSAASILRLEDFVDNHTGLARKERMRLKIAATEVFENILMHNRSLFNIPVLIRFYGDDTARLSIRYFSTHICSPGLPDCRCTPYYDPKTRRYRGLGLRMCSNLTRSIVFRKGLFKREIIIIL